MSWYVKVSLQVKRREVGKIQLAVGIFEKKNGGIGTCDFLCLDDPDRNLNLGVGWMGGSKQYDALEGKEKTDPSSPGFHECGTVERNGAKVK